MNDQPVNRFAGITVDGQELQEGSTIYLRMPEEPTTGEWCSPFEVTDKPQEPPFGGGEYVVATHD